MPLSQIIAKLDIKKLKNSFLHVPVTAKNESWATAYDKSTDSLYITPKSLPKDASLYNITNELAVYVTPNSQIKGIFIENYSSNFVKHNTGFEGLLDELESEDDDEIYVSKDEEKTQIYQRAIEEKVLEIIEDKNQLLNGAKIFAI